MSVPVVLFAFNRPEALRRTLQALSANDLASETPLFIFLDGPRREADIEKVQAVQDICAQAHGFLSLEVISSSENRGLANSVIQGVGRVLASYDSVIVLEDDLVTHPGFLSFMNAGLERYREESAVFSVCGYSSEVRLPAGYAFDGYFCPRSASWGWATWRDRWQSVDWTPTPSALRQRAAAFNRWGGSDCTRMLRRYLEGKNSSWAIRFCYSQFLQGKTSLFPCRSLVDPSAGFDGKGTHCNTYNRFRYRLADAGKRTFALPDEVVEYPSIRRSALRYHSLPIRAKSFLFNLYYDLFSVR